MGRGLSPHAPLSTPLKETTDHRDSYSELIHSFFLHSWPVPALYVHSFLLLTKVQKHIFKRKPYLNFRLKSLRSSLQCLYLWVPLYNMYNVHDRIKQQYIIYTHSVFFFSNINIPIIKFNP